MGDRGRSLRKKSRGTSGGRAAAQTLHHGGHGGHEGSSLIPSCGGDMRFTKRFFLRVLCVLCGGYFLAAAPPTVPIYGFTARSSAAQRSIERRFLTLPSADKARDAHVFLTAEPHVAGSPRDRELANWIRDRWREAGLEQVEIVEHDVFLPYATNVSV